MRYALRELAKHFSIYAMLLRMNIMSQMEYRANFVTTFRRSDAGIFLVDFAAGLVMTAIGLSRSGGPVLWWRIAGYAFCLAAGSAVGYALYLIPQALVFRIVNAQAIAGVADSFWDFNNVPMIAYGKIGRAVGTYLVPMFVITSFPALFAPGRMTAAQMVWGAIAPFAFLAIARFAWTRGIRHYASVSY